jgi:aspartyl-tRNA(Asn)/glutamyl-tRNA(Gln) amidotransferase subunit B
MAWQTVVGLEVHAQLFTRTKAFCGCTPVFGAPPNTHVCPVCLGLPGALPVLNERAVELAVMVGLALGCALRKTSIFARKNYFYPDLPKGYQITQYDCPYAEHGVIELSSSRPRIRRVHMEEDAGKSFHERTGASIVDLNRAGTPLVEIVSEPDLSSGEQAAEYLHELRDLLLFLGVCDGNLEEGSFRCDANVSIRPEGTHELGTRVELKNINSFRFVAKAIEHEARRQRATIEAGGKVIQETRGWDEKAQSTFPMRSKETAQDYRYFPEPDLPPLVLDQAFIERVRSKMPELPKAKRARWVERGISPQTARVLTQHPKISAFFEATWALHDDPVRVANFITSEVLRDTKTHGLDAEIPLAPAQLAGILDLVAARTISGKQAKELYAKISGTDRDPNEVARELGMKQVTDVAAIEEACKSVIAENPKQAEAVRGGKKQVLGFLVGQVMKATGGKANPALVSETLERLLS